MSYEYGQSVSVQNEAQRPLTAKSGHSNVNIEISLLSVCFRPKADARGFCE